MKAILNLVIDELRGAWRFRWYALMTAWAVALAGWLAVLVLPNRYEATARVFVDPSTSLKPVIQGLAIEQDVNAELNLVRQSLLSEPQLEKVAATTGLGARAETPQQKMAVIKALRERIEVEVTGTAPPGTDSYNQNPSKVYAIRYQDSSRERSLEVVQILLSNFMEGTLGGKRQGSIRAQKFLEDQITDYEQRLSEAEERLATFKKQNVGLVPGEQQGDYFTRLQNEIDAVRKSQGALSAAVTRRETLQRQLRGEGPIAASAGTNALTSTGVAGPGGDALSRIKETQAKLDQLLERYTDKHPDVIALRETLDQLKARRLSELEGLRRGDPNAAALTGASNNPVYQSIQLALNQSDIDIAALRAELHDHQEKVADLKRLVDTMPQVEAEFARLNRNYAVTKGQYTALAERLEKARVGEGADATGSVRFEVIDPPAAGFKPVFPRRSLFMAAVLAGALAIGVGFAYLLNLFRPVFNSTSALADATGLMVLGSVGRTLSDSERVAARRVYWTYSAMVASLFAAFVIVVLIGQWFAPLGSHLYSS